MGIQLEVNAEIFTTIHNLLAGMRDISDISPDDEATLYNLWRKTVREMSKVELRNGYGIPMEDQIIMTYISFIFCRPLPSSANTFRIRCSAPFPA